MQVRHLRTAALCVAVALAGCASKQSKGTAEDRPPAPPVAAATPAAAPDAPAVAVPRSPSFVRDFVQAWAKVSNLDRFDLMVR